MDIQYKEIKEKEARLKQASQILKTEFVGLDEVIDKIIESVSPWFLFSDLQERPVVVNLWGLTGVGKSSLAERLACLLGFKEKYYHFDLGNKSDDQTSVKSSLEEIFESDNGFPCILAFDEFQHARSRNEFGQENEVSELRVIWQLLDSGKFQFPKSRFYLDRLYNLIKKLEYMLEKGVAVELGKVVRRKDYFLEMMNEHQEYHNVLDRVKEKKNADLMFFPSDQLENLFDLDPGHYRCIVELKEHLMKMDGVETINILWDIFIKGNSPRLVDCSKSLIFVMGNLDEVYTMHADSNPDRSADEFHLQSLSITVPKIKSALQKRFRNEQIARLGNNHIIYPAFHSKTYEEIIRRELNKISRKIMETHKLKLEFAPSVCELIYREGVYPTQGTRPVFSTIHQLIKSKLWKVFAEIIMNGLAVSRVLVEEESQSLKLCFVSEEKPIHKVVIPLYLSLGKLRTEKRDDMQAIIAVHESGHAVLSAILLKTVPEEIYSHSAGTDSQGFVFAKMKWKYVSRKEIIPRVALMLGGMVAERMVFGEDNLTTGAEEDIAKASEFITEMLKSCGMGDKVGAYHAESHETRSFLYDPANHLNAMAEDYLVKGLELAGKTLKEQEGLLLHLADYLSDHRKIHKEKLRQMIEVYARNFDPDTLIENGAFLFYRKHLKDKVKNFNMSQKSKLSESSLTNFPLEPNYNYKADKS